MKESAEIATDTLVAEIKKVLASNNVRIDVGHPTSTNLVSGLLVECQIVAKGPYIHVFGTLLDALSARGFVPHPTVTSMVLRKTLTIDRDVNRAEVVIHQDNRATDRIRVNVMVTAQN